MKTSKILLLLALLGTLALAGAYPSKLKPRAQDESAEDDSNEVEDDLEEGSVEDDVGDESEEDDAPPDYPYSDVGQGGPPQGQGGPPGQGGQYAPSVPQSYPSTEQVDEGQENLSWTAWANRLFSGSRSNANQFQSHSNEDQGRPVQIIGQAHDPQKHGPVRVFTVARSELDDDEDEEDEEEDSISPDQQRISPQINGNDPRYSSIRVPHRRIQLQQIQRQPQPYSSPRMPILIMRNNGIFKQ